MKKSAILFASIVCFQMLIIGSLYSQPANFEWAKIVGDSIENQHVTTDIEGNLYLSGSFKSPTITFGNTTLINDSTYFDADDIFLVKYNKDGSILWAKSGRGKNYDEPNSITTDPEGNIYLTGVFSSPTLSFGTFILQKNENDNFSPNIFLIKLDKNGNVLWGKSTSGLDTPFITLDIKGNIYVTGTFSKYEVILGKDTLINSEISTGNHYADIFIVKYNNDGKALWARSSKSKGDERSTSICVDKNCDVYIAGYFGSWELNFGKDTLIKPDLQYYNYDLFIAKFDTDGNFVWNKRAGGDRDDLAMGIATDNNSIYLTGAFISKTICFGSISLTNKNPATNVLENDFYIAKYTLSGILEWVKSTKDGAKGGEAGTKLIIDNSGNIGVLGIYSDKSLQFDSTTLQNMGGYDSFFTKYNPQGDVLSAISLGGDRNEFYLDVSMDSIGNFYFSGLTQSSTLKFGNITFENNTYVEKIFLVKVNIKDSISTSVFDNVENQSINFYPNPSDGKFYISGLVDSESLNVIIYNVSGSIMYKSTANSLGSQIDLSDKPKGTYIYQLQKDNVIVKTGKLVLE